MASEIIIFSRSLPFHHLGGMEIVAWEMAVNLQTKGFDVTVVTTDFRKKIDHDKNYPNIIKIKGIPPATYSNGWWQETENVLLSWSNKKSVCAIISISAGAFSTLKHKDIFPNAKFIMQAHGTSMGEFISKWRTKDFKKIISSTKNILGYFTDARHYNLFDYIIAVGDAVFHDLKSAPTKYICGNASVIKIENGIDHKLFSDSTEERGYQRQLHNIDDSTFVFISASRLHEQKGIDRNITLFSEIKKRKSNVKYIICGDGPYEKKLKELVHRLELSDDVIFHGAQPRHELAKLLQCADAFLFLTKRVEGLPLNVLEAMSAGVPSIISDHLMFPANDNILKCNPEKMDVAEIMTFLSIVSENDRKSYIPEDNTLNSSVEKYISLFKVN